MPAPTFDEVLTSARQLPVEDQLRLRNALPASLSDNLEALARMNPSNSSPFSALAGMIDEPPQNLLSKDDQEIYGG
jgi:hypothetical protein